MKKYLVLLIGLLSAAWLCGSAAAKEAQDAPPMAPLLDARQTSVWVEGQRMGDLVLGARGALQFVYVDEKLSKAITANPKLESWVYDAAQYFGTEATQGKALFIVHLDVYKPWNFDYEKIAVGDYHPDKNDILTPSMTNPFGELDSKYSGFFSFTVPASIIQPGSEVTIGYGEDSEKWTVPKK